MGAVEGSASSVAVCVTGHVRVLSVFLCVSETYAQLHRWLNLQRESGRHIPQRGQRPCVPALGSSSQAGGPWPTAAGEGGCS